MNYNNGNAIHVRDPLLPAMYVDFSPLGGDDSDIVVFLTSESPLLKMAEIQKQLISYDASLLDMPGQNTTMNIAAKNYTMLRIEKASNKTKMDVRNTMIAFFEHLKSEGVVKSFEVVKHGNTFHGIKFPRLRNPNYNFFVGNFSSYN